LGEHLLACFGLVGAFHRLSVYGLVSPGFALMLLTVKSWVLLRVSGC
jgi:hypothetical protein